MARGRAANYEDQRGEILRRAAALFAREGFHHASMAQLAAACGVSKPLLYHYARDKEQILFDIMDTYMDRLLALARAGAARSLPARERLVATIRSFMGEYAHSRDQHRVLVQDLKFVSKARFQQVIEKERATVAVVARMVAAVSPGVERRDLETPVTMVLFGMINWTFTWLRPDGALSYDDLAVIVAEIFLNGSQAPAVPGLGSAEATGARSKGRPGRARAAARRC